MWQHSTPWSYSAYHSLHFDIWNTFLYTVFIGTQCTYCVCMCMYMQHSCVYVKRSGQFNHCSAQQHLNAISSNHTPVCYHLSLIVVLPFWFSAVLFVVTCTEATCIVCCVKHASVLICGSLSVCLYKTINYYIIGIWCNIVEIYVSWWNLEVIRFSWDLTLTFGHENLLSSATNIDSPCSKCWHWVGQTERQSAVCADVTLGLISVVLVSASREKLAVFGDLYTRCARLAIECWWVEVVFDCSSGWLYFLKAHATTRSFRLLSTRVTAMHRYKVTNYTCHTCHWLLILTFTHWPRSTSCQLCDTACWPWPSPIDLDPRRVNSVTQLVDLDLHPLT